MATLAQSAATGGEESLGIAWLDELRAELNLWALDQPVAATATAVAILLVLAWVADRLAKAIMVGAVRRFAGRTKATWDDKLVDHKVFHRIALLAPIAVILWGIDAVPGVSDQLVTEIHHAADAAIALVVMLAVGALLNALDAIYSFSKVTGHRSIKTYTQLAKLLVYLFGTVIVVATLLGQPAWPMITGLGAVSAILLLVFKDTILSFIASIQIGSYDMVRVGDWIEMPSVGADGDVIDIGLHTVKVQNWNKTITTVPTHKLISESFKNWRGMSESGGRRIKRNIDIDMNSVRFLEPEEIDRLESFNVLADYIQEKRAEIKAHNDAVQNTGVRANERHLTNIGTFRAYLLGYLRTHPKIHQDMTLLVRQLQPTDRGLPIELYCFSNDTAWANYEDIQGDIFDHILAMLPEFGLRAFQSPSGRDFSEALAPGAPDATGAPDEDVSRRSPTDP